MPLHYALTDALVALIAGWGVLLMQRSGRSLAAVGLALFSIAGAIGTVRITSGLIEPLANFHKAASQLGGIAGLSLLIAQLLHDLGVRQKAVMSMGLAAAVAAFAAALPSLGPTLFVMMLIGAVGLCLWSRNPIGASGFGLMLLNVTLLRRSDSLGPDWGWHIYHIVVASWLFCVTIGFLKSPRRD